MHCGILIINITRNPDARWKIRQCLEVCTETFHDNDKFPVQESENENNYDVSKAVAYTDIYQ